MANKYSGAIEEAEKQIDSLKIKLEGLHKSILDNAKEFNNIFKGGGADLKVIKAQIELVNKQMALLNKENQNAIVTEKKLQSEIKTKNDLLRLEHNEIKKNISTNFLMRNGLNCFLVARQKRSTSSLISKLLLISLRLINNRTLKASN